MPAGPGPDHDDVDVLGHRHDGTGAIRGGRNELSGETRPVSTDGPVACHNHWLRGRLIVPAAPTKRSRMNVVVCVKQIPDPAVPGSLVRRPHARSRRAS